MRTMREQLLDVTAADLASVYPITHAEALELLEAADGDARLTRLAIAAGLTCEQFVLAIAIGRAERRLGTSLTWVEA
jgi:hypothetical protein